MSIYAQLVDLKHNRNYEEPKYIALEDLNFAWLEEEIALVKRMWRAGKPIWDIADALGRPQEEVMVLLIDLAMKNHIKKRAGGIFGSEYFR